SVSDDEFPHESLSLNSASSSNLLSLFSSWSKADFDLKGCFLDAMDVSQFPGRKNSKNVGRAQDKALGTICEMLSYSNVLLCDFSVFSECHFLSFSNLPPVSSPIRPDAHRERNPDDRCRHPPEDITGDTAGETSRERRTRLEKNRSRSSAAW
ncbi:unnamed protein product, partial [Staurois parvus]